MDAPEFYHNGQRVQYISYLQVYSGCDFNADKRTWREQHAGAFADVIRHFREYTSHQDYSLCDLTDLGNDHQPNIEWYIIGCLLADYSGNIYFAGISHCYLITGRDLLQIRCDRNYRAILQQIYTQALFYLDTLELGDVAQVIKQCVLQMLSYDIHYKRASINWHGDRAKI
jgi:hypothetical protein